MLQEQLRGRLSDKRIVILGVGNPLRGDDGAGPALIERLQSKVNATLIDAGDVPENYLGPVEAARPQVVLIVDAAQLGATPGDIALVEIEDLAGSNISTHNSSLALVARVISSMTGAEVLLLAIQPETIAYGAPLSPSVDEALKHVEELLVQIEYRNAGQDVIRAI